MAGLAASLLECANIAGMVAHVATSKRRHEAGDFIEPIEAASSSSPSSFAQLQWCGGGATTWICSPKTERCMVNPFFCRLAGALESEVAAADGVVNATPVGMHGFAGNPVPACALKASHWVADVVYTPIETMFIKAAAKGARVLTGGGMCVHQAAEAFRLFTGVEPDIVRMHRTFAKALTARDTTMSQLL
jgi:hypothetical protein